MLRAYLGALLLALTVQPSAAQDPDLTILNVDTNGILADSGGSLIDISDNGRYAFLWSIDPLVPEDSTGFQYYVHDLQTGALELISVATNGLASADQQFEPRSSTSGSNQRRISDDGRFVVFASRSSDLVPSVDPGPLAWLFLRDRQTQTTTLVSVNNNNEPANQSVSEFTMDPTGVAILFESVATNLDPIAPNGGWFLHRTDAPVGSSVRTRAACRDRTGTPRDCISPSLSCGGALIAQVGGGPIPWIEGEDLPFGGRYSDIMIGNAIDGNWVRVGAEADNPLPPDDFDSSNNSHSAPAINCTGNRIAFWTTMALRSGDTNDSDLYVFDLLSRQLWLIEEPIGTSLAGSAGTDVAMASNGIEISFSTNRALDASDTNGFSDIYFFEMPPNPSVQEYDFYWVSNNDGVPATNGFIEQLTIGGRGVAGFRTAASNPPWPAAGGSGPRGQLYARSNLPLEFIHVDGFE